MSKNRRTVRMDASLRIEQILTILYKDHIYLGTATAVSASLLADKMQMRSGTHFNKLLQVAIVSGYIEAKINPQNNRKYYMITRNGIAAIPLQIKKGIDSFYGGV